MLISNGDNVCKSSARVWKTQRRQRGALKTGQVITLWHLFRAKQPFLLGLSTQLRWISSGPQILTSPGKSPGPQVFQNGGGGLDWRESGGVRAQLVTAMVHKATAYQPCSSWPSCFLVAGENPSSIIFDLEVEQLSWYSRVIYYFLPCQIALKYWIIARLPSLSFNDGRVSATHQR